jgi:hypothetical protein
MTGLAVVGGLAVGYVLGRLGWFVLVLIFDGED